MSELELDDIQGVIIRGYRRMRRARHMLLRIEDAAAFRSVLGALATEDLESPFVTVAAEWVPKPPAGEQPRHCVNIGLTYSGLRALGVGEDSLASFPAEFREGAVARAARVGDSGANDPQHWMAELRDDAQLHVVLSLHALDNAALEAVTGAMRAAIARGSAASELRSIDAAALYDDDARAGSVHFGYRDGLSQPTIAGAPASGLPDPLGPLAPGNFLLGHPSQWPDYAYPVPVPEALGRNGSFAAFRVASQDVRAFEDFLVTASAGDAGGPELLAARLCGRWRNGVPLELSPDTDTPVPPIEDLNMFDYAAVAGEVAGSRCPLGSHIRRVNPRRQPGVTGAGGLRHRVIRRGMPYGSPFDPAAPDDGEERGLVGLFICVSLRDQFEFLMLEWIDDGASAPGLRRTRDPLAGNPRTETEGAAALGPPYTLPPLPRFVTTRGGAYCFLPSMTALRYLAAL